MPLSVPLSLPTRWSEPQNGSEVGRFRKNSTPQKRLRVCLTSFFFSFKFLDHPRRRLSVRRPPAGVSSPAPPTVSHQRHSSVTSDGNTDLIMHENCELIWEIALSRKHDTRSVLLVRVHKHLQFETWLVIVSSTVTGSREFIPVGMLSTLTNHIFLNLF